MTPRGKPAAGAGRQGYRPPRLTSRCSRRRRPGHRCDSGGSMKALFEEMAPLLPVDALVIDTGSTKADVLRWAAEMLPPACDSLAPTRWRGRPNRPRCRRGDALQRRRLVRIAAADRPEGRHRRCGQADRNGGRLGLLPRSSRARWAGGVRQPPAVSDGGRADHPPRPGEGVA